MGQIIDFNTPQATEYMSVTEPPLKDMVALRVPPEEEFIQSMENQVHPILIGHNDKDGYFMIAGRKRLAAVRIRLERQIGNGMCLTRLVEGISKTEGVLLGMEENAHRDKNEIADAAAIRELLRQPGQTYQTIAELIHKPVTYVKGIDQKWGKVAHWAVRAALEGKLTSSNAILIGTLPPSIQDQLHEVLKKEKKLTGPMIRERKNAVRAQAMGNIMQQIGPAPKIQSREDRLKSLLTKALPYVTDESLASSIKEAIQ